MRNLHFWITLGEYCTPLGLSSPLLLRSYCRDGEHASSTSATLKRRIQALVLYVSTSLAPSERDEQPDVGEGGSTTDIITHLLDLATLPTGHHASETDLAPLVSAARAATERTMNVISAREFLTASCVMLKSEDTRVRLSLIASLFMDIDRRHAY